MNSLISPRPKFSLILAPRLPALLRRLDARSRISWFRRIMGVSSIGSGIISPAAASAAFPGATVSRRERLLGVVYNVEGSVVAAGRGGVIGFGADGRTRSGSPKSNRSSNSASFFPLVRPCATRTRADETHLIRRTILDGRLILHHQILPPAPLLTQLDLQRRSQPIQPFPGL